MLKLDFINVGSGDATLVRTDDFAMLVDCGNTSVGEKRPGSQRRMAAKFLREEGVRRLDLVVLTHLHRDHMGGLAEVLRAVRVDEIWTTYLPAPGDENGAIAVREDFPKKARGMALSMEVYLPAIRLAQEQGVRLRERTAPEAALSLAPELTARLDCAAPEVYARQSAVLHDALNGRADSDALYAVGAALNGSSLRLTLSYHGQTVLLPGDAYGALWADEAAPCTILKVPHHASSQSLDRALAARLSPRIAVISCGAYRLDDRPHPAVVEALCACAGEVFCTDACETPGLQPEDHRAVTLTLS